MKPVVRGDKIEPRLMLPMGLSYDHRVIDGGDAARFTVDLVKAFENFKEEDVEDLMMLCTGITLVVILRL